jgi:hypothetical protein
MCPTKTSDIDMSHEKLKPEKFCKKQCKLNSQNICTGCERTIEEIKDAYVQKKVIDFGDTPDYISITPRDC